MNLQGHFKGHKAKTQILQIQKSLLLQIARRRYLRSGPCFSDVRAQLRPDDREQRHRRDDPDPGAGAGEDQHDAAVGPHLVGLLTPARRAEGKGATHK